MTVNLTIIGLGRIGASMGLALAAHKDQLSITGHDKLPKVAQKAQKLGAVNRISFNLPASIEGADVVVLALPLDQVRATLEIIARDIRQDAVVLDTAPVKSVVAGWMKELLPAGRHYVGLIPALNPLALGESGTGPGAARADLFQKSVIAVAVPRGTADGAIKLAADLVTLLGAQPYFSEPVEVDGMMAVSHLLPGMAAAALAETAFGQPGWNDIRKVTGGSFAAATRPLEAENSAALAEAALQNQANVLRVLDEYIRCLQSLRDDLRGGEKNVLQERLERSSRGHAQWQLDRAKGDWLSVERGGRELPKTSEFMWKQQIGDWKKLFGRRDKQDPE